MSTGRLKIGIVALVAVLVLAAGGVAYAGLGVRAAERDRVCDGTPVLNAQQRERLAEVREGLREQLAKARSERDREEMSQIREQMWQAMEDVLTDEQLAQMEQKRQCNEFQRQRREGHNGRHGGW